jgi:ABC-2 type transport system permease protein
MHNIFTIVKREYMERVRSRSFLVTTILIPALFAGMMFVPAKIASMRSKPKHIAVVTSTEQLAGFVQKSLTTPLLSTDDDQPQTRRKPSSDEAQYTVDTSTDTSDANREQLRQKVQSGAIDAFIWMPDSDLAQKKVTLVGKQVGDFMEKGTLRVRLTRAIAQNELTARGFTPEQADSVFKYVKIDSIKVEAGAETKSNESLIIGTTLVLVMLLYGTLLFYGITVMRAVVEEKTSRVMEVLLSSVSAKELMAGKIIGVGSVGLTQVLIWIITVGLYGGPTLAAMMSVTGGNTFHLDPRMLISFAIFFLLGYALYSTLYAAVGASINTEQEGQQLQMIFAMPLIIAVAVMFPTIQNPNSTLSAVASMIPFTAPIIMYIRFALGAAPLWQVAVSIVIMVVTIYLILALCSRIYRVGILMYGKRPTLPELVKWLKYAGA